jgi:hypothetical protein
MFDNDKKKKIPLGVETDVTFILTDSAVDEFYKFC